MSCYLWLPQDNRTHATVATCFIQRGLQLHHYTKWLVSYVQLWTLGAEFTLCYTYARLCWNSFTGIFYTSNAASLCHGCHNTVADPRKYLRGLEGFVVAVGQCKLSCLKQHSWSYLLGFDITWKLRQVICDSRSDLQKAGAINGCQGAWPIRSIESCTMRPISDNQSKLAFIAITLSLFKITGISYVTHLAWLDISWKIVGIVLLVDLISLQCHSLRSAL